ncbi:AAA family ATPase [Epibacterium sp. SM1979]|uniref:Chromosome partition protein Smc n=1 Tax=Tritonibacter litoralis TaxID=2662264 RepID=A0A843YCB8_9RHOB|nr:AAA family ATPase [Tritonibacter litoralis]MQQ08646.1 AAA family ATPase [Tritonibacter litoralis]
MRFSKLRLNGFKSFVDPTDLIISDGLTGVVGPNGCGKSNLLEALRWVMGENRPKAMRGGGMEDVIFAGASARAARNFAEVSLQIDNTDRLAPSGFNDADQLDIVRRITRDVGSAYKANGKDTRARDVQMLFADASTGAHSPSLVRQGQISELINAKPKARRRILEEAAGISGLYQRRHEAELKLKNTEQNLLRVDDVIEQLAGQLGQLARQARQAARYRSIGETLRHAEGALLYRRWREADVARLASEETLRIRVTQAAKGEALSRAAAEKRGAADVKLPPLREEEAIATAILQRLVVQRDALSDQETQARQTIETLNNRIRQLGADIERESGLNRDAGETIERLEWEQRELEKAGDGQGDRLEEAAELMRNATTVLQRREDHLAQVTEDVARLAARHQSARRLVEDCKRAAERAHTEGATARAAMEAARDGLAQAQDRRETVIETEEEARAASEAAEEALAAADELRTETQSREAEARAQRSEADGELGALRSEAAALAKLVARDTAEGGQVLDALRVEPGYEKALGAALADDLRAPLAEIDGPSGWVTLQGYDRESALPEGVKPLALFVSGPEALSRRMTQIGVVDADQARHMQPRLRPGQRLVTLEGDLWRWDGYRTWAEDAPSAAALRLEQMNRLEALKQEVSHAEARADGLAAAHDALQRQLAEVTEADQAARQARRVADQRVADAARALSKAEADCNLAEAKLETLAVSLARHDEDAEVALERLEEAQEASEELPDLETARAGVEEIKHSVEAARITMISHRSAHDELRRDGEARIRRKQEVIKELSGWNHRLETAGRRIAELVERRDASQDELEEAMAKPAEIEETREELNESIADAEARKSAATEALIAAEAAVREAAQHEKEAERLASEAREERARAEALTDSAREAVQAAAGRIIEEQQATPQVLLERLAVDPEEIEAVEVLEEQVGQLKRQRDSLGAVNLRAEEDARGIQVEHDELVSEKQDLEEAVKTLRAGISSLNREGRERLLTAFEQVNSSFSLLFQHLFGGGEANLVMVESDDPLDAGLEIMCQPPGKKLSTLSLLSGGEQTLTALALIFAVFLSNPAPICVLDEVDAPLDDANVTRFCDLLDEMCRQTDTRFLIITHHAVTMARMDRLFGVTMQEKGVSQLVSVDLKKAEALVA